jgi:hypothetical protein
VDAVRAAVARAVVAGHLDRREADRLARDLAALERNLDRGDLDRAAERIRELRDRLDELRREDRLSAAGHASILAALDALASTLPDDEDDD